MRALIFLPTLLLMLSSTLYPMQARGSAPDAEGWPFNSIYVELRDKIHTRKAEYGDTFDARLTRDLYKGDFLIAEAGSPVKGTVLEAIGGQRKPQRRRAELEITLTEIEIDDEWVPLESNTLKFKTKRDFSAVKVGSGLALGALIGGFRGAAVGGLAGLGWAVLTSDKHIKLKKGSELEFSLRKGRRLKQREKVR
jgi:hypothetical protein